MVKRLFSRISWRHIWLGASTLLLVVLAIVAALRMSQPPGLTWEKQPYGPLRAIVWAVTVAPEDAETLYVGVYGSGVYKSTDGGKQWTPQNDGLAIPQLTAGGVNYALNIQDFLIRRAAPQTLYVATWGGDGIYRSDNGGQNWQREIINVWDTGDFALTEGSVQVRTLLETEDALFAGTAAGVFSITAPYSGDWYPTPLKGSDLYVTALLAHPTQKRILYAATLGHGIYKSLDGGQTWIQQRLNPEHAAAQKVNALLFAPDTAEVMVAGTFGDGVYRSVDAGEHWETWSEGLPAQAKVWSLAYAPDGTLFAGLRQGGTYTRTASTPWQKLATFPYGALALEPDPTTGAMIIGTWGAGIYRSSPATAFQEWQNLNIPAKHLRLTSAVYGGGRLYVGTESDGVYASSDHGITWERLGEGLVGVSLGAQALAFNPAGTTLYLGTAEGLLMKSVDATAWTSVTTPVTDTFSIIALSVASDAQNNDEVYVGTAAQGLWRYMPASGRWSGPQAFRYRTEEKVIAYVPSILTTEGQVYVSVWGSGVHKSTPFGAWPPLQLAPKYIENLMLARKAWFQWGGRCFYAQTEQGLYRSRDGETWSLLYPGLTDAVTFDPQHPQVIYAGLTNKLAGVQTTDAITATAMFVGLGDGEDLHGMADVLPQEAGSIRQLLRAPEDDGPVFALTTNGGLYRGQITLPWLGREVAVWGGFIALAYFLLALIPYGYLTLIATYALERRTAADLLLRHFPLLLRLRRPRFQNRLQTLTKLILALVAEPQFELTDAWDHLDRAGIIVSRLALIEALEQLVKCHILEERDGKYRYVARGVPQVAVREFAPHIAELSEEARYENRLLTDVANFFEAADFDVRLGAPKNLTGFVLRPRRLLYRDYRQLYVRLKTRTPLTADEVRASCAEIGESARKIQPEISHPLPVVFFVVDMLPESEAFRQLHLESARVQALLLSVAAIRRAQRDHSEQREVDWRVQHSRAPADFFDIRTPVIDQLDFFGQATLLKTMRTEIKRTPQVTLWGLPAAGKTSLLWALKESLVTPLVAYVDLTHCRQGVEALREQLINDLTQDLWAKYKQFPDTQAPDFEPTLLALLDAIPAREVSDRQIVLFLDGVMSDAGSELGAEVERWQALAQRNAGISIVMAWQNATVPDTPWIPLGPLTAEESAQLLQTLGARMGRSFTPATIAEMIRRSGGHPMLLRQLGSLVAQAAANHATAEATTWITDALPEYERICERYLSLLWHWLPSDNRAELVEWAKNVAPGHEVPPIPGPWGRLWQAQGPFTVLFSTWVRQSLEEDLLYG